MTILDILRHLIYGPVMKKELFAKLQPFTTRQFDRELARLVRMDLINIRKYPDPCSGRGFISVLLLTKAGANKAAEILGMERDLVRTPVPAAGHLGHELGLAEMYKRIFNDVSTGRIRANSVKDDAALRREYVAQSSKKKIDNGVFFPDFDIALPSQYLNVNKVLCEFDHGNKGKGYWLAKINFFSSQAAQSATPTMVLLVATNAARLSLLQGYTLNLSLYRRSVYFFITLQEFIRTGLKDIFDQLRQHENLAVYNCITREAHLYK